MLQMTMSFVKQSKLEFAVNPAPRISTVVVEPYNSVLTTHATMEFSDCCFTMDNEAIYDICSKNLRIGRPDYGHLNALVAQVVYSVNASLRFRGTIKVDINELLTNLVPYPRIHFPLVTYAPILSAFTAKRDLSSVSKITSAAFSQRTQWLNETLEPANTWHVVYSSEVMSFQTILTSLSLQSRTNDT